MDVKISEMVNALTPVLRAEKLNDRALAAKMLVGYVDSVKLLPIVLEVAEREVDTPSYKLNKYYYDPEKILKRMARKKERKIIDPLVSSIRQGHVGSKFLLHGLGHFSPLPKGWIELLVSQLKAKRPDVRVAAIEEIAKLGQALARKHDMRGIAKWIRPVIGSLKDRDEKVSVAAERTLKGVGAFPTEGFPDLAKLAIGNGQADLIREYVEMGVPLNQPLGDGFGTTPLLHLFFGTGACDRTIRPTPKAIVDVVKLMIAKGADVNLADNRGNTPLMFAARRCDATVIKTLIDAGADIYAENKMKYSPFLASFPFPHEPADAKHNDAAKALIDAGFRLSKEKYAEYLKIYKDQPAVLRLVKQAAPK
jgi:hypothetical protein